MTVERPCSPGAVQMTSFSQSSYDESEPSKQD